MVIWLAVIGSFFVGMVVSAMIAAMRNAHLVKPATQQQRVHLLHRALTTCLHANGFKREGRLSGRELAKLTNDMNSYLRLIGVSLYVSQRDVQYLMSAERTATLGDMLAALETHR